MTYRCELSRARGVPESPGVLLPGDSRLVEKHIASSQLVSDTTTTQQHTNTPTTTNNNQQQQTTTNNNNNNTMWGGSVLTGEEPPPHSGELKHALPQAGGPTQSQLSRPMSSGHHISMEHRLRRNHLNSNTNASN